MTKDELTNHLDDLKFNRDYLKQQKEILSTELVTKNEEIYQLRLKINDINRNKELEVTETSFIPIYTNLDTQERKTKKRVVELNAKVAQFSKSLKSINKEINIVEYILDYFKDIEFTFNDLIQYHNDNYVRRYTGTYIEILQKICKFVDKHSFINKDVIKYYYP